MKSKSSFCTLLSGYGFIFFLGLPLVYAQQPAVFDNEIVAMIGSAPITKYEIEINGVLERAMAKNPLISIPQPFDSPYFAQTKMVVIIEHLIRREIDSLKLLDPSKLKTSAEILLRESKNQLGPLFLKFVAYYDLHDQVLVDILIRKLMVRRYFEISLGNIIRKNSPDASHSQGDPRKDKIRERMKTLLLELKEKYNVVIY